LAVAPLAWPSPLPLLVFGRVQSSLVLSSIFLPSVLSAFPTHPPSRTPLPISSSLLRLCANDCPNASALTFGQPRQRKRRRFLGVSRASIIAPAGRCWSIALASAAAIRTRQAATPALSRLVRFTALGPARRPCRPSWCRPGWRVAAGKPSRGRRTAKGQRAVESKEPGPAAVPGRTCGQPRRPTDRPRERTARRRQRADRWAVAHRVEPTSKGGGRARGIEGLLSALPLATPAASLLAPSSLPSCSPLDFFTNAQ
jgi:hypothetical protein